MLKMVVFNGMKLLICLVDDVIDVFNDFWGKDKWIFVIVNSVVDVIKIVKNVIDIESVNVVNVGCFDKLDLVIKIMVFLSV